MTLTSRALRYGLTEEIEECLHAVQRFAADSKSEARQARVLETFRALVDAVDTCDRLGGHDHEEPMTHEGRSDGL